MSEIRGHNERPMAAVSLRDSLAIWGQDIRPRNPVAFQFKLTKDPARRDLDDISPTGIFIAAGS